jgi:uncharacterized protein
VVARTDTLDLSGFRLHAGEGRRLDLEVDLDGLDLAGQQYVAQPRRAPATLDVSRMTGGGFSLRLRFEGSLAGPCMRCLAQASPQITVDAREIDIPGGGEELDSPYVEGDLLDLNAWAHDAFALAAPEQILCTVDCPGLCAVCAVALRDAGPEHHHQSPPDPRWAKLQELRLE